MRCIAWGPCMIVIYSIPIFLLSHTYFNVLPPTSVSSTSVFLRMHSSKRSAPREQGDGSALERPPRLGRLVAVHYEGKTRTGGAKRATSL